MRKMHTEKAARGQTIRTETGPVRESSHKINESEALLGRKNTGGPTSTSHSLTSGGDVVTYNDKK